MKTRDIATLILALAVLCLPSVTEAQVDKRVEVTKDYEPVVTGAMKLPIVPDMADTVKMRPEIDYTITPLMYSTELVTAHSFNPAKVTYWDFNRPTTFYLKLGVGYPVNTVGDFFISTHNVRTGYLMAAATHYGEFGARDNGFGDNRNATQAVTRGRVAGGVYVGKRMFEGELAYGDCTGRRFAAPSVIDAATQYPTPSAEYEDFTLKLRFGDDFVDLSRTNFNIDFSGSFFHDKSDRIMESVPKLHQFDFGVGGRVGRNFGRHYLEADLRYAGMRGVKDLKDSKDDTVWAGLRYGYNSETVGVFVGADYCFDKSDRARHYVLPYAKLHFNITNNDSVIPFVELEGALQSNDYYSLARHSVYVDYTGDMVSLPNTLSYDLRFGIEGKLGRGRFSYRLYAGWAFESDALYWYTYNYEWLRAVAARRDVFTLNLEADYRPIDQLIISAGIHGRFFKEYGELNDVELKGAESPLEGVLKLRYAHKKFSVGASARVGGAAEWTNVSYPYDSAGQPSVGAYSADRMPAYVDVGVDFEWNVKSDWRIFVEGSNLANMHIYNIGYFREQGIRFTAGFKFTF